MPLIEDLRRSVFARIRAQTSSSVVATVTIHGAQNVTSTSGGGEVIAQDGMARNLEITATRLTRAQVIEGAKKAGVPQRKQMGPTCGLYALGMVMDSWNEKDPKNPTALVQDADLRGKGSQYTREPTTNERILDYAKGEGFTALGEMFTATQLAETARHFGYDATTHLKATLADLYRVLDAGHPAIVGFDVDYNGNPADLGGERAHYAVIEGYFDDAGERYLIARHGWGVQKDHVWKASDFDKSWRALQTTGFYGTPGDGVVPRHSSLNMTGELPEPSKMQLPDAGNGRAQIFESLGTKIVEVVPKGEQPVGGVR